MKQEIGKEARGGGWEREKERYKAESERKETEIVPIVSRIIRSTQLKG